MTPQERELIEGLFQRLKATDVPEKDKDAEQLIQARMAALSSAAYQLVQTVLVQEHALAAAQARIEQLEKEGASRGAQPASGGTSFLGGLLGRNRWNTQGAPEPAMAQPGPRSSVPITAPGPAAGFGGAGFGGGSFLSTALTTAAGVAGGALLYDGLRSMLFHNPGPFGPYVGTGLGQGENVYETVNNYYGDDARRDDRALETSDPNPDLSDGLKNADYDPSDDSFDSDPGGNFGGSEDV